MPRKFEKNFITILCLHTLLTWLLVSSQTPYPDRSSTFTTNECYMSLADPTIMLIYSHNHPSGPNYIRTMVAYDFDSMNNQIIHIHRDLEHHFVKVAGRCQSTFAFSARGILKHTTSIDITLYVDFGDVPFAYFHYESRDYIQYSVDRIYDQLNHVAISASIKTAGSFYYQDAPYYPQIRLMLALRALYSNTKLLCLFMPNNQAVVVNPTYETGMPPFGLISKVTAEYSVDGQGSKVAEFLAYGCDGPDSAVSDIVAIVEPQVTKNDVKLSVKAISYRDSSIYSEDFTLPDVNFQQIDQITGSQTSTRVFLIKYVIQNNSCDLGRKFDKYKSESGTFLYGIEYKSSKYNNGIIREDSFPISENVSC